MTQTSTVGPPPLSRAAKAKGRSLGVGLAILSCFFPVLPMVYLIIYILVLPGEPDKQSLQRLFWFCQGLGAFCGLTALLGMGRWGHQTIWMLACIGLAFVAFMVGMTFTSEAG